MVRELEFCSGGLNYFRRFGVRCDTVALDEKAGEGMHRVVRDVWDSAAVYAAGGGGEVGSVQGGAGCLAANPEGPNRNAVPILSWAVREGMA